MKLNAHETTTKHYIHWCSKRHERESPTRTNVMIKTCKIDHKEMWTKTNL